MVAVIFVVLLIAVAVAVYAYRLHLKKEALKCSQEARQFHVKVMLLSSPTRLFTDEELRQLKVEVSPLLRKVNNLYKSYFISNDYLDNLGLADFIEERTHLNHSQYVNNRSHQADGVAENEEKP